MCRIQKGLLVSYPKEQTHPEAFLMLLFFWFFLVDLSKNLGNCLNVCLKWWELQCVCIYIYTANCVKIWAHVYWKRINYEDEESKAFGVKRESRESCFLIAFTPQENKHRLVWCLTSASGWHVFLTSSKK